MVAISEALKDSVDLLCFLGQLHFHQQLPQGHVDGIPEEHEPPHIAPQNRQGKLVTMLGNDTRYQTPVDVLLHTLEVSSWSFPFLSLGYYQSFSAHV